MYSVLFVVESAQVQGIPTLVILDGESGDLITDKGREMVMDDPQGECGFHFFQCDNCFFNVISCEVFSVCSSVTYEACSAPKHHMLTAASFVPSMLACLRQPATEAWSVCYPFPLPVAPVMHS